MIIDIENSIVIPAHISYPRFRGSIGAVISLLFSVSMIIFQIPLRTIIFFFFFSNDKLRILLEYVGLGQALLSRTIDACSVCKRVMPEVQQTDRAIQMLGH